MRNAIVLLCGLVIVGLWLQSPSDAQCPGGVCPVPPQRVAIPPRVQYINPQPVASYSVQSNCPGGVCPQPVQVSSGPRWTWPGDLGDHLQSTHGVSVDGMSQAQMEATHNRLHNQQRGYVSVNYASTQPVRYTRSQPVRRVFGRLFSRLRCGR